MGAALTPILLVLSVLYLERHYIYSLNYVLSWKNVVSLHPSIHIIYDINTQTCQGVKKKPKQQV